MNKYINNEQGYFCVIRSDYIEGRLKVVAPNEDIAKKRAVYRTLKDYFKSQHEQVEDNPYYIAIKTGELLGDQFGVDKTWAVTDAIFEELGWTCEVHAEDDFNFVIG